MNDLVPIARTEGEVLFHGQNIYAEGIDPVEVRKRVGMVFQKPNPFPKSIYENIAWGARINGFKGKKIEMDDLVAESLKDAALWDEVHDKLQQSGLSLSGGQQQRLCIACAIAVKPDIILMDEPCSALDPISTLKIEELMRDLSKNYTIIIVTHNMQQAARVSDQTAFMYLGEIIEFDKTEKILAGTDSAGLSSALAQVKSSLDQDREAWARQSELVTSELGRFEEWNQSISTGLQETSDALKGSCQRIESLVSDVGILKQEAAQLRAQIQALQERTRKPQQIHPSNQAPQVEGDLRATREGLDQIRVFMQTLSQKI